MRLVVQIPLNHYHIKMIKIVILAACVFASAQAQLLVGAGSFASSPALGAPLVGKVTYNAPEVTVVKQPVVVDQHEARYRAVPTIVQTAPVVRTVQPVVQAVAAPAPAVTYAAPALAHAPALTYAAAPAFSYGYGYAHHGFAL